MGLAHVDVLFPRSQNADGGRSSRGANIGRHKRKRARQSELVQLLLAAGVPRPIPGDRVHVTAEVLTPTARRRDEDNYRSLLSKALGDALSPSPTREELDLGLEPAFRWLSDDTPDHFTFGTITFALTPPMNYPPGTRKRQPARAVLTIAWGEDLLELKRAELAALEAKLAAEER